MGTGQYLATHAAATSAAVAADATAAASGCLFMAVQQLLHAVLPFVYK